MKKRKKVFVLEEENFANSRQRVYTLLDDVWSYIAEPSKRKTFDCRRLMDEIQDVKKELQTQERWRWVDEDAEPNVLSLYISRLS